MVQNALCMFSNGPPDRHMNVLGLGDGPQRACNGQTDNPNSDFNLSIQSMPSNTQAGAKSQNAN
jgi:hypothetical protein